MEEKTKKKIISNTNTHPAVIIIAGLAIILSIVSLFRTSTFNKIEEREKEAIVAEDISYNVYIGLTDKNQNKQIISDAEAFEIVKTICINNNASYTIYNANGGYKSEGIIHTEKTLVLEMDRITEDTLHQILTDIKRRLNVGSVMVLKQPVEVFDY